MRVEAGSMTIVMCAVVATVVVLGVAVASVGTLYAARAQATNASDAAALAAAVATYPPASTTEPVLAAQSVARANGAVVLACRCPRGWGLEPRTVEVVSGVVARVPIFGEVTVRVTSRAEFDPMRWLGR